MSDRPDNCDLAADFKTDHDAVLTSIDLFNEIRERKLLARVVKPVAPPPDNLAERTPPPTPPPTPVARATERVSEPVGKFSSNFVNVVRDLARRFPAADIVIADRILADGGRLTREGNLSFSLQAAEWVDGTKRIIEARAGLWVRSPNGLIGWVR